MSTIFLTIHSANHSHSATSLSVETETDMFVGCQTRSLPTANPSVNTKKAPAKAGAFLGCEIQKGASSGCVFSVAGAVGADSFRSSLRIENALICHAVICAFALFFPLPTSFS